MAREMPVSGAPGVSRLPLELIFNVLSRQFGLALGRSWKGEEGVQGEGQHLGAEQLMQGVDRDWLSPIYPQTVPGTWSSTETVQSVTPLWPLWGSLGILGLPGEPLQIFPQHLGPPTMQADQQCRRYLPT